MSSTSVVSDLHTAWQTWHSAREAELTARHGWLSLASFNWLPQSPAAAPGLPGLFAMDNGHATLTAHARDGYALADSAVPVDGTVRARVVEGTSLNWLTRGDVLVELALRGGRYLIRTHDPGAAALVGF